MRQFEHILFPVDLSAQCEATAPHVAAMVRRFDSRLTMAFVMEPPTPTWYTGYRMTAPGLEQERPEAEDCQYRLDRFLADEFKGLKVERLLLEGDAAAEIARYARHEAIDLIMMPTSGHGRFRRFLLGSVTAKVLHDVFCPVWTAVHLEEIPPPGEALCSIVCAVDLQPDTRRILQWAALLCETTGARLTAVHALPDATAGVGGMWDAVLQSKYLDQCRSVLADQLRDAGVKAEPCIWPGDVGRVVRHSAVAHSADAVVIGRGCIQGALGRLRTHAYGIIQQSPCPVISV